VTTSTSKLIKRAIDRLAGELAQGEIARKAGFEHGNMLSMIKHGKTRLPLDRVPALAKTLRIDPGLLFRTALADYWPEHERTVRLIFRDILTENEWALVELVRSATSGNVPSMNCTLKIALTKLFAVSSTHGSP
jgi:transcriptional regulator with XRE-family HTH domain